MISHFKISWIGPAGPEGADGPRGKKILIKHVVLCVLKCAINMIEVLLQVFD